MKPAFILLVIVGIFSQAHFIEEKNEVRWAPSTWCGHGPPYSGTLFHTKIYGFPFPAFEVVSHESCTTIPNDRMQLIPEGLVINILIFGALGLFLNSTVKETK